MEWLIQQQGRNQDFLKWGSNSNVEVTKAGVWGLAQPLPLRDFQCSTVSKLSKLLYLC